MTSNRKKTWPKERRQAEKKDKNLVSDVAVEALKAGHNATDLVLEQETTLDKMGSSYRQGLQTGSSYHGSAYGSSVSSFETQLSSANSYSSLSSQSEESPKVEQDLSIEQYAYQNIENDNSALAAAMNKAMEQQEQVAASPINLPVSHKELSDDSPELYERSVPFGKHCYMQVVNEPDRVKSNIGLTQRSFERFDNAPVMRVPAYGFSGEDYTQLARQSVPSYELLLQEIKKVSSMPKPEPIFSQTKLELPRITYGRGPVFSHSAPALRAARAAKVRHEHNQEHATAFNARQPNYINARESGYRNSAELNEDIVPFLNGTQVKVQAHKVALNVAQQLLNSLVEQEHNKIYYSSPSSPHVTLAASESTHITYALPPKEQDEATELQVTKLNRAEQDALLKDLLLKEEQQDNVQELKQKASELKESIMDQGHTVLIGDVTCAQHEADPTSSIVVVKSQDSAFVTSSEVKTLIRDYKARALHGTNNQQLEATKQRMRTQQVTLPPEYFYEAQQVPKSTETTTKTLLGSESTRIIACSSRAMAMCQKLFNLPIAPESTLLENEEAMAATKLEAKPELTATETEAEVEVAATPKRRTRTRRKR